MRRKITLNQLYSQLFKTYGPQEWWPVYYGNCKKQLSRFSSAELEIMLGAILTQNTAWKNVKIALANLNKANLINWNRISRVSKRNLGSLIRPTGYYNQKASYLQNLIRKISQNPPQVKMNLDALRQYFLDLKGIGPETCDSILLYAFNKPIFVVDAYTKRFFARLGLVGKDANYSEIQNYVHQDLTLKAKRVKLYQEFHALIVKHCVSVCLKKPKCQDCPFESKCEEAI